MKVYCTTALRFYFKTWKINNAKSIPASGPIIFIPNHQNAFLDAVLVICSTSRNPWSIARASVFKEGLATRLLTMAQIKPVFRSRDGFGSLRNNDAIIQEWIDMLAKNEDILIFAEGNHNEPYAGGTLQKGFARMTMQFKEKNTTPLTIVPVGIHYEDHHAFRSRVLINFGDPIRVNEILEDSFSEREKLETIVTVTDDAMKKLALAIPADDDYKAKFNFLLKHRKFEKDMMGQLEADKNTLKSYPLAPAILLSKKSSIIWKIINPIIWIGYVLHILPYLLIKRFIEKNIKDPQWISSLKYAFGIFLVPMYYIILLVVFYLIIPNGLALLAFAVLLPVTGIGATDFLKK
ncbi:MAG TPA: 1-acyl-sn-glycerol-3-phosphate acyltransferase [Chryseolinea sp.]|nr:1-acyl-sn-glycerol-3-phosphate acyltransferase [Chryseolinea sp.]